MEYHVTVSKENFVKEINKIRLGNKNKWVFIYATVNGTDVFIKNYETYLQRFLVNDIQSQSGLMDMSVAQWKEELANGVADV